MNISGYSKAKSMIGVITLTALLNGCASYDPEYRTVTDHKINHLGDNCKVQETLTEKAVPIFTQKEEKKIASGKIERREELVINTIENIYEDAECRNANLVALLAKNANDPVTQAGMLLVLSHGSEELKQFMQWGIGVYGLQVDSMEANVKSYHDNLVKEQIASVPESLSAQKPDSFAVHNYIINELYTGKAFPDTQISLDEMQALIDVELVEACTSIERLRAELEAYNATRPHSCETGYDEQGNIAFKKCTTVGGYDIN
jgi:hypothetical protein